MTDSAAAPSINLHYHNTELNWGDSVNPRILQSVTGRTPRHIDPVTEFDAVHLLGIGSILHRANARSIPWGSGFMFADGAFRQRPLHILAVRGPLSRQRCLDQGVDCPDVLGDAALLAPDFLPRQETAPAYKYGLVPHFKDADHPLVVSARRAGWKIISPKMGDAEFIRELTDCEHIASSSLHGLIAAEAYGIPTAWLILSDKVKGGVFKFHDHYAGHGIQAEPVVVSESTTPGDIRFSDKKLRPLRHALRDTLLDFLDHNPLARLLEQESAVDAYLRSTKLTRLLKRKYGLTQRP